MYNIQLFNNIHYKGITRVLCLIVLQYKTLIFFLIWSTNTNWGGGWEVLLGYPHFKGGPPNLGNARIKTVFFRCVLPNCGLKLTKQKCDRGGG